MNGTERWTWRRDLSVATGTQPARARFARQLFAFADARRSTAKSVMASMTTSPPVVTPLPAAVHAPATVRIEPPHGWLDLRLADVWEYRELLYFFVWRDVKVRYKQTVIGVLWVVLQPLLTMGVFTIFFGRLAKLPSEGLPYPVFYFAALVPWAYFSVSLSACTGILVGNQHVITKVYFPRLVLPLAAVCTGLLDLVIGFVVMIIITLAYGFRPGREYC